MEWNDIYDEDRNRTGRVHRRGLPWNLGEYGLAVCIWVYDGQGKVLLTRRAKEKSFAGTWENSGGRAQAGESSRETAIRELREETGIWAKGEELELLKQNRHGNIFYDHYCLKRWIPLEDIQLQPGETDGVQWADFAGVHEMIRRGEICQIIGEQFESMENALKMRNITKNQTEFSAHL